MTTPDAHDAGLGELAGVTPLVPDPARAERVRCRCRAQIARRARRTARTETIVESVEDVLVPVLLGLFSALYAAVLLGTTLRLEGVLR